MPSIDPELKIMDELIEIDEQQHQVRMKGYHSAFVVHLAFKIAPLALLQFNYLLDSFFMGRYVNELVVFFVVLEFWFTKNIVGKRMIGARWFFGKDQFGVQRLMFQCRANHQMIDFIKPKLFWIVQVAYCILPVLFMIQTILVLPTTTEFDFRNISLNVTAMISGVANNFFFMKISTVMDERQQVLKTRLGADGLRKIGLGSITSYF